MDSEQQLFELNHLSRDVVERELLRCCGSPAWAASVSSKAPFESVESLMQLASTIWWNLPPSEWHMAFRAHPQIGDASALSSKFSSSAWEGDEQKGTSSASEATLIHLATLNKDYLIKHGFIFLICATGKSADEMITALESRLGNDSNTELQIAAGEQDKITKLRLQKLLASLDRTLPTPSRL
mmetsp:Transcript_29738/g.49740  ORF Transcript_29738/g.49740 Transcript_29738/m.49740 type:complete len:183 (+) Transcript_29738:1-549(+)